jgi:predicted enzyme related to lactoylglutathione lyase
VSNDSNPVIHFDIPTDDSERARRFYESAFGWQTTRLGPEMGDYVLAFTVETDEETRLPAKRGAINGGLHERTAEDRHVKLTILVDDIREAMSKIEAAGGTIVGEPVELPGVGLFVSFVDTEGNIGTVNQDFTVKSL